MKNYEDTKCAYGYITLCEGCVEKIRGYQEAKPWRFVHIHLGVEVNGMPLMSACEWCGKKGDVK